jgi:hypothetical protein
MATKGQIIWFLVISSIDVLILFLLMTFVMGRIIHGREDDEDCNR